jgi:ABC-type dipeptide/oligopeptide/nickel transport systems, permease components
MTAVVLVVGGWLGLRIGLFGLFRTVADLVQSVLRLPGGLPTVTSRELIPNQGYQTPDGTWQGTFRGLSPALAWGVRVTVVFAYVAAWLGWLGVGTRWYQRHYRQADWTPRDDVLRRLRGHRWGQFGLLIVAVFLTMALFAPALGTAPADQALYSPFSNSIEYYDSDSGAADDIRVGQANLQTRSEGFPDRNVGPLSYDQYDRFHPFGTMTNGKDLFTFLVHGARVSLVIGLLSVGVSTVLATVFALVSAYYRGVTDLLLVVTGDTIMGVPRLLLLILLTVLLSDTWLAELYDGGVLLALILAGTGWPFLWRSFRGPALQVAEEDWVDAARSYGQSAGGIMRLHVLPYLVGYLLIYSSLVLGGVILAIAGLSFLGLGITAPTPEWGRAVDLGREYVATESWHISLIPGVMITLVVMGFNAVGDALRDAVDPQSDAGVGDAGDAESRGGGA